MAEHPKVFIQLSDIPEHVESASHAYSVAFKIARAGDLLGWRQLVKCVMLFIPRGKSNQFD